MGNWKCKAESYANYNHKLVNTEQVNQRILSAHSTFKFIFKFLNICTQNCTTENGDMEKKAKVLKYYLNLHDKKKVLQDKRYITTDGNITTSVHEKSVENTWKTKR